MANPTATPAPEPLASALGQVALATMEPQLPMPISWTGSEDAIALPAGYTLSDLEKYRVAPRRVSEHLKLTTLAGFIAYVNRYRTESESLILINPSVANLGGDTALATAVMDYHAPDGLPAFASHKASYLPTPSPAYALLCNIDGKLLAQDEFAQRLRDLARFCTSHGAELLETIRTLSLTSSGEYQSHNDDISGSVRLKYNVKVEASAGTAERALTVPSTIEFSVPVFLGDKTPAKIAAELLYRTPRQSGGQVQLGIRMPDRAWLEYELIEGVAEHLRKETELLVITGTR